MRASKDCWPPVQRRSPLSSSGLTGQSSIHHHRRNKHWSHLSGLHPCASFARCRLLGSPGRAERRHRLRIQPVHHAHLRVLTARIRPSCAFRFAQGREGAGNAGCSMLPQPRVRNKKARRVSHLIWVSEKAKYFSKQGWTGFWCEPQVCQSGKSE